MKNEIQFFCSMSIYNF